jgi:hypothetical protein
MLPATLKLWTVPLCSDERPVSRPSRAEIAAVDELREMLAKSPVPEEDLLGNLVLYLRPQLLSHTLAVADIYRQVLDMHGVILDLGTRYGKNMITFSSLRRIYEPYNYYRKIVGFDTFSGFPEDTVADQDGPPAGALAPGTFGTPEGYVDHLAALLRIHEQESPLAHIRRYDIKVGDIESSLAAYFRDNPQVIVALAYFDLDLYRPTKSALEQIMPHTAKGTILAFDEPTHDTYPGETIALKESMLLCQHKLRRFSYQPTPAYIVLE